MFFIISIPQHLIEKLLEHQKSKTSLRAYSAPKLKLVKIKRITLLRFATLHYRITLHIWPGALYLSLGSDPLRLLKSKYFADPHPIYSTLPHTYLISTSKQEGGSAKNLIIRGMLIRLKGKAEFCYLRYLRESRTRKWKDDIEKSTSVLTVHLGFYELGLYEHFSMSPWVFILSYIITSFFMNVLIKIERVQIKYKFSIWNP